MILSMVGANQQRAKETDEVNQVLRARSDSFHHPNAAAKQLNIANHHVLCILSKCKRKYSGLK